MSFFPPPERDYTALEISAVGSWSRARNRASYVLSRTRGNYTGLYNADLGYAAPGFVGSFMIPGQAENSTGYLPSDRTHVIKLIGNYAFDFGLSLGGILLVDSGAPVNEWAPGAWGTLTPIFVSERGSSGRSPWLWDLSLRFTYNLPTSPKRPLQLLLDVLHVGDPQRAVWVDEFRYSAYDLEGNLVPNPNYKQPVAYQPPMALRLGIQATF